jgi:glucan phosphoethanolaminetransferase (alkaline phosphatase superfamily)
MVAQVRRLAVTLIAVVLALIAITYYGIQAETLAVQIETSIEQALAQVSIPMVALTAFIALLAVLLLRLLTGKTRSLMGVRS